MKNLIVRFVREEAGQDLIEYALIATFVSLVASVGATALGTVAEQLVRRACPTNVDAMATASAS